MDTKFCGQGFCEDDTACVFDLSTIVPKCLSNNAFIGEVCHTGIDCDGGSASCVIVFGLLDELADGDDESILFNDVYRCVSDNELRDITAVPSS